MLNFAFGWVKHVSDLSTRMQLMEDPTDVLAQRSIVDLFLGNAIALLVGSPAGRSERQLEEAVSTALILVLLGETDECMISGSIVIPLDVLDN